MARYGESFLTRPILITTRERWANKSRMQFRPYEYCSGCYVLSWLGVINGFPILSKYWRLACTVDEKSAEPHAWPKLGGEIVKWSIIKASRCEPLPQKL